MNLVGGGYYLPDQCPDRLPSPANDDREMISGRLLGRRSSIASRVACIILDAYRFFVS